MKSETCFGKSGEPLSVFMTEAEARKSADYELVKHHSSYRIYPCKRCGLWHLSPQESHVEFKEHACSCTDSQGGGKRLYASREDAEKARISSEKARDIRLEVYECPEGGGWHLTHR